MAGSGSVPLIPDLQILDPKVEDRRFHSFQISRQFLGGPRIAVNTFIILLLKASLTLAAAPQVAK